jgi:phosphate transport system protein
MSLIALRVAMPPRRSKFGRGIKKIDQLCTSLSQELLVEMMEKSVATWFGAHLMFCTKNLERMGDHATNIAEAVHYMVKGEALLRERPKADFTSMLTAAPGRI